MVVLSDAWIDFVAGWCSGSVAVLVCQPMDTILTRWQATVPVPVSSPAMHSDTGGNASTSSSKKIPTPGTRGVIGWSIHDIQAITRGGSTWKVLWRGSSPMIGAVPMQNALLMGGYGLGQKYYHHEKEESGYYKYYGSIFVGGITGGIVQSFLMSPVELIKVSQQVQINTSLSSTTSTVIGYLTKQYDVAAFWRGLSATLLRDGVPHGIWFVAYDWCKNTIISIEEEQKRKQLINNNNNKSSFEEENNNSSPSGTTTMSWRVPLVSGAFAATVAWGVGYPADLIKTRIQAGTTLHNNGIVAVARQIIAEDPNQRIIASLYRGFGMKLLRAIPGNMIGFSVYEIVKEQIIMF